MAVAGAVGPLARRPIRIDSPKLVSSHAHIAVLVQLKTCLRFLADSAQFMIETGGEHVFSDNNYHEIGWLRNSVA